MKRAFDLVVAASLLLALSPVILVLLLLARLKLGSPVIFTQVRPGLHGRPFRLYKLRTMADLRDGRGELLADELRLVPFGRFLRSMSLDELPQLYNVLRGDLSLVGPRPLLMEYLDRYTPEQARRHEVRPGITGWAQINGRNTVSWPQRLAMDVWYVDNRTFRLDLVILLRTVKKTLLREGITQPGRATMEKFRGGDA